MKKYITKEQAMYILPDGDSVHTFINIRIGLCGADWDRESILKKIQKSDILELTGESAKGMGHGLCAYNKDTVKLYDVLFIETDMKRLQEVEEVEGEPQKDHFREETKKIQTHIDREALCGVWEREADGYADGELVYDVWRCGDCGHVEETDDTDLLPRFCPSCGRAMTPEAWAELEKRLRG